jgi:uncharacterized protein (TIGR00730 family)
MNEKQKVPVPLAPELVEKTWTARESWRVFGIMSEFVEATERLAHIPPAVSIFGSARVARGHPYYQLTEDVARRLSDAGFSVISGGGPGAMEAANKGAFAGRSPSVGLNIQLPHEQTSNQYQDVSQTFSRFFVRKVMFVKFACAYVVVPGGFGTMDELMEALTLVQTGKIRRFPIILMQSSYWRGLIDWIQDRMISEGMIEASDLNLIKLIDEPDKVVAAIFDHYEKRGFEPTTAEREAQLNL